MEAKRNPREGATAWFPVSGGTKTTRDFEMKKARNPVSDSGSQGVTILYRSRVVSEEYSPSQLRIVNLVFNAPNQSQALDFLPSARWPFFELEHLGELLREPLPLLQIILRVDSPN